MTPDGTCSFSFDPDGVAGERHPWDEGEGVWDCPHPAEVDDLCVFHAPPAETDDDEVVQALLSRVEAQVGSERERRTKQFVGARFGDLDLSFAAIDADDNFPLDLRHCHVAGDLDCKHATFYEPVDFRGATVAGDACFEDARFYNDAWLEGAAFEGNVNCFDVQFDDDAHAAGVRIEGDAVVEDASFRESMDLSGGHVVGELDAGGATFVDEADMEGVTFEGPASFAEASFQDDVYLQSARLEDRVSFAEARFDRDLVVRDLSGEGTILDLTGAWLTGGRFQWTVGDRLFDVTGATIGDVTLEPQGGPAFEGLHVEETTFDGFDFGEYIAELAADEWDVHSSAHDAAGTNGDDDPATVENTYVKAKNGAKVAGNDRVAAEFFLQEMRYRAKGHRSRVADGDLSPLRRIDALGALFANRLLGLSTGYGERPSRVVAVAVAVVLGFAGVFALAMPNSPPFGSPLGYLVISATSFVTLVLAGSANITRPEIHLLAEVEGFVGAFLIALFVFTLTRSINR